MTYDQTNICESEEDIYSKKLGKRLRSIRQFKGLTQGKVSETLGVSPQQYQKYEVGQNRITSFRLIQLAKIFNINVCEFYSESEGFAFLENISINRNKDEIRLVDEYRKLKDVSDKLLILQLIERISEN